MPIIAVLAEVHPDVQTCQRHREGSMFPHVRPCELSPHLLRQEPVRASEILRITLPRRGDSDRSGRKSRGWVLCIRLVNLGDGSRRSEVDVVDAKRRHAKCSSVLQQATGRL